MTGYPMARSECGASPMMRTTSPALVRYRNHPIAAVLNNAKYTIGSWVNNTGPITGKYDKKATWIRAIDAEIEHARSFGDEFSHGRIDQRRRGDQRTAQQWDQQMFHGLAPLEPYAMQNQHIRRQQEKQQH